MRISDWSSDVCSSDLSAQMGMGNITFEGSSQREHQSLSTTPNVYVAPSMFGGANNCGQSNTMGVGVTGFGIGGRSEEHTSELQSLMRISYAVFCLKKKNKKTELKNHRARVNRANTINTR